MATMCPIKFLTNDCMKKREQNVKMIFWCVIINKCQ